MLSFVDAGMMHPHVHRFQHQSTWAAGELQHAIADRVLRIQASQYLVHEYVSNRHWSPGWNPRIDLTLENDLSLLNGNMTIDLTLDSRLDPTVHIRLEVDAT